jgi:hypothetical protein
MALKACFNSILIGGIPHKSQISQIKIGKSPDAVDGDNGDKKLWQATPWKPPN